MYSEPCQESKVERFLVTIFVKSTIIGVCQGSESVSAVTKHHRASNFERLSRWERKLKTIEKNDYQYVILRQKHELKKPKNSITEKRKTNIKILEKSMAH